VVPMKPAAFIVVGPSRHGKRDGDLREYPVARRDLIRVSVNRTAPGRRSFGELAKPRSDRCEQRQDAFHIEFFELTRVAVDPGERELPPAQQPGCLSGNPATVSFVRTAAIRVDRLAASAAQPH